MQGTAREEGKIWQEGPKDFFRTDWTLLKFQQNYEQLIWFCGCVTPCVCFPFCEEPSVTLWVALTCAPQLQKPMRVLFEMQPMPTIFANLREWWFELKYLYCFICKGKYCPFFHGSLVGKKLFLKHTDAVVVSAGGNSWNCFSTGGWNNLWQILYGFIWVNQNETSVGETSVSLRRRESR